jgi:DNA polymerase alpha subunit A
MALIGHAESDAWLALGLMFYLSVVPLTLQLSNLSGFLWGRTLQGNRAQRIEMLLLHEFHRGKFLLPDKPSKNSGGAAAAPNTSAASKNRGSHVEKGSTDGGDASTPKAAPVDTEEAQETPAAARERKSKGPQYAGGLVLEPKKGIYNKCVLLLDFNSLYPSIIQEFNICFTTVVRPTDDSIPPLPQHSGNLAPLPLIIQVCREQAATSRRESRQK